LYGLTRLFSNRWYRLCDNETLKYPNEKDFLQNPGAPSTLSLPQIKSLFRPIGESPEKARPVFRSSTFALQPPLPVHGKSNEEVLTWQKTH
jgi:hypothetical protein